LLDVIIRHGKIVDGSGAPSFHSDLGVKDSVIAAIGDLSGEDAAHEIDAHEMVVAPGFIDVHTHSDITLLVNPKAESAVRQGVTTHVFPNCGMGTAPAVGEALKDTEERLRPYGLQVQWCSVGEFFSYLEKQQPSINVVPMVAHGTIRMAVLGYERRRPNSNELDMMRKYVEDAMKSGARGLCSGLRYVPDGYADIAELVELCKVVKEYDGIYTSHIRSEGDNGDWFDAINEAIAIGEGAGVPVQISHLKALGKNVWGKSEKALAMIEAARARSIDVACDQYPYEASSSTLMVLFPQWAVEGGIELLFQRLADKATRSRIQQDFEITLEMRGGPQKMTVSVFAPDLSLQGKTLLEVAQKMRTPPFETAIHLLRAAHGQVNMIFHVIDTNDVRRILGRPYVMVGSDGSALAPYGPLAVGYYPHPRNYGCFPRVLARFVREEGLLTLEEAVHKMTRLSAVRFRLADRGLLRPSLSADVVIFDPLRVQDTATFEEPQRYPNGIHYVLVNGKLVVDKGEHTGVRSGMILRGNRLRSTD
jgi:N-acyl-D-amino-acid deacylase